MKPKVTKQKHFVGFRFYFIFLCSFSHSCLVMHILGIWKHHVENKWKWLSDRNLWFQCYYFQENQPKSTIRTFDWLIFVYIFHYSQNQRQQVNSNWKYSFISNRMKSKGKNKTKTQKYIQQRYENIWYS